TDALDAAPRLHVLLCNALAGNMFDWGAAELHGALARGTLDLAGALGRVARPPRFNNPEQFAARALRGRGFARAVVFVDNSGADVILGVLPLARFLAARGTTVVLAANTLPALNDVTAPELEDILRRAAAADKELADAAARGRLLACATGSAGPCLDLCRLDPRLVRLAAGADLVVIVGMGRAILSNYRTRFTCDSLRLAVFKNKMAADAAGAAVFDSLCLYTPGTQD
ncbi:hypothetical protein GGH92_008905, partial [Coemansia sp. RSA 2673]